MLIRARDAVLPDAFGRSSQYSTFAIFGFIHSATASLLTAALAPFQASSNANLSIEA
jgi:hypothetical protein